jgi:O-antigen/teichoic acid export membrane protein
MEELGALKAVQRFYVILLVQGIINLAFTLLIYFDPQLISRIILNSSEVNDSLNLVGIVALLQMLCQVPMTFLLGLGEFRRYAFRTIILNLITLFTAVVLLFLIKPDLQTAILSLLVSLSLNISLVWFTVISIIGKHKARFPSSSLVTMLKSVIGEGFIFYLGNVLAGAIMNFVLIGLFARYIGIAELGFIRIAAALVAIIGIIPTALQTVSITFLAKDSADGQELKSIQLRYVALLSFFASAFLLFFLDFIIGLLFGIEYLPGHSIYVFMIVTNIMIMVSAVITNFLVAKGHASYVGVVSTIGVLLYTIIAVLAIPRIGIYGYFLGHLVGYAVGFLFVTWKEFRLYHYPDLREMKKLTLVLLVGMLGLLPAMMMEMDAWNYLYRVVYLITMVLLVNATVISHQDRERMRKVWQSVRKW